MPALNEVLTHGEMCAAEGGRYLQKGMNYRPKTTSVLLMSRRKNAPYRDEVREEGRVLVYEGHDIRPTPENPDPKTVDQPLENSDGRATDNGKFFAAAKRAKSGSAPIRVHVYEKLVTNVWSFNGAFLLVDAWVESDGRRRVCKFKLDLLTDEMETRELEHSRVIPGEVKAAVWARDSGRCVECGAQDNLHFDHIIPFSKGGTSLRADNIQILCARHNLQKHDRLA